MTQSKNSTYATVFCDGGCRRIKIGMITIKIKNGKCPGHQFLLLCRKGEEPLLAFHSPEEGWPTEAIPKRVVVNHSEGPMSWQTELSIEEVYMRLDGCRLVVMDKVAWETTGPLRITLDESEEESW